MRRRDFLKGSLVASVGAAGITRAATEVSPNSQAVSTQETDEPLITPIDLRCESTHHPLGIDAPRPRLSWKLEAAAAAARNQIQSAYRITVASTEALLAAGVPELWDSSQVLSNWQLHIE